MTVESLLASVFEIVLTYVYPALYTTFGVFAGIYLNRVIDTEKERTDEIFRPLLSEVQQISTDSTHSPLSQVQNPSGGNKTVLSEVNPVELMKLNENLYRSIRQYLDSLEGLQRAQQRFLPEARLLVESGYDHHLTDLLPSEILAVDDEGVDPSPRPDFPGPALLVGKYTSPSGEDEYFEVGPRAPVTTHRRYPAFAFLLENFSALQNANGPADIRTIVSAHEEMNLAFMDEKASGWENDLWAALVDPFQPENWNSNQIDIETEKDPGSIIAGESFFEVLREVNMVTSMRVRHHRGEVIDAAEDLRDKLLWRLNLWICHPKRIRLALGSSWVPTRNSIYSTRVTQRSRSTETADASP